MNFGDGNQQNGNIRWYLVNLKRIRTIIGWIKNRGLKWGLFIIICHLFMNFGSVLGNSMLAGSKFSLETQICISIPYCWVHCEEHDLYKSLKYKCRFKNYSIFGFFLSFFKIPVKKIGIKKGVFVKDSRCGFICNWLQPYKLW